MFAPIPISAQDQEEVLQQYERGGMIAAVLDLRRRLGLGLAHADATVRATLKAAGHLSSYPRSDVQAGIIATGSFQRSLVPFLDYGERFFEKTREGARIIVALMFEIDRLAQILEVAGCLGVDPWDFNTHVIDPERVNTEDLRIVWDDDRLVERFNALRAAGFRFHFRMEFMR
ncbi:hypothetical protein OV208_26310 [Corallococcus sp. bb12-1]|uniref:hypothetical protein n=1 Tax=Corallococcus sp. bb12-1 TaxID=2996784 RepID=UPI002271A8AE|nr:hypothetical protein [Corallococcus sp. bb12-1]MCY1044857.1 hypothetical protein [Corallococcus sp. bb12-1]